jgi:hypothetical protein
MTVERGRALLADLESRVKPYDILWPSFLGREAMIVAECIVEAVRADADANRKPRPKI